MREVVLRPEEAEEGTCRTCKAGVWWVVTYAGVRMPLDREPDPEGNIEMWRVDDVWRAEVLYQVESLFPMDRPRWRSHFATCPDAAAHRTVPAQRAKRRR